jgi:hypothetical protein
VTSAKSIEHRPAALTALRGGAAPEPGGYPVAIWLLLGGNFVVRAAGFAYPFMAYWPNPPAPHRLSQRTRS